MTALPRMEKTLLEQLSFIHPESIPSIMTYHDSWCPSYPVLALLSAPAHGWARPVQAPATADEGPEAGAIGPQGRPCRRRGWREVGVFLGATGGGQEKDS